MTDMYSLSAKTAIVTSTGKGLGKTITRFLLDAGMKVAKSSYMLSQPRRLKIDNIGIWGF
ncbi:hypothetical protein [Alteromonas sp. ALT199]|uniref:hypothetical protein n=1 Tax=unclassified Alteromonas TaxID=2614992 RepID=UPI0004464887|nr:hypothetical protein [Alteromonas sp. ALT199]